MSSAAAERGRGSRGYPVHEHDLYQCAEQAAEPRGDNRGWRHSFHLAAGDICAAMVQKLPRRREGRDLQPHRPQEPRQHVAPRGIIIHHEDHRVSCAHATLPPRRTRGGARWGWSPTRATTRREERCYASARFDARQRVRNCASVVSDTAPGSAVRCHDTELLRHRRP